MPKLAHVQRRSVLAVGAAAATGAWVHAVLDGHAVAAQPGSGENPTASAWPNFPHQHRDLVRDTVGASHGNEARVRELVEAHPALANAAWDWGFGDWETALGAAAHTGRRSIAEFLIERGARVDLFAAVMLGHLDAVRGIIGANPAAARIVGPHGISLMRHAEAGGEAAAAVRAYLATIAGTETGYPSKPLTDAEREVYIGTYTSGPVSIEVSPGRTDFRLTVAGTAARVIHFVGDHTFYPAGAPAVRIVFDVNGDKASALTIRDHDLEVRASRAG